jgi:hypothetical protein
LLVASAEPEALFRAWRDATLPCNVFATKFIRPAQDAMLQRVGSGETDIRLADLFLAWSSEFLIECKSKLAEEGATLKATDFRLPGQDRRELRPDTNKPNTWASNAALQCFSTLANSKEAVGWMSRIIQGMHYCCEKDEAIAEVKKPAAAAAGALIDCNPAWPAETKWIPVAVATVCKDWVRIMVENLDDASTLPYPLGMAPRSLPADECFVKSSTKKLMVSPTDTITVRSRDAVEFIIFVDAPHMVIVDVLVQQTSTLSPKQLQLLCWFADWYSVSRQDSSADAYDGGVDVSAGLIDASQARDPRLKTIADYGLFPLRTQTDLAEIILFLQVMPTCKGITANNYPDLASCTRESGDMRANDVTNPPALIGKCVGCRVYNGRLIYTLEDAPILLARLRDAERNRCVNGKRPRKVPGAPESASAFRASDCTFWCPEDYSARCCNCTALLSTLSHAQKTAAPTTNSVVASATGPEPVTPSAQGPGTSRSPGISRRPLSSMTNDELIEEVRKLREWRRNAEEEMVDLQKKVQQLDDVLNEYNSLELSLEDMKAMSTFLRQDDAEEHAKALVPEGMRPSKILRDTVRFYIDLEKKRVATGRKYGKGIRYPLFLIEAGLLYRAAGRKTLDHASKILPLPSARQLSRYSVRFAEDGHLKTAHATALREMVARECPEPHQREVMLLFDEVKLMSDVLVHPNGEIIGLAASAHTDDDDTSSVGAVLEGFKSIVGSQAASSQPAAKRRTAKKGPGLEADEDSGEEVNEAKLDNKKPGTTKKENRPLAQYAFVWHAISLFSNLRLPLGYVPVKSVTGAAASGLMLGAIAQACQIGLTVVAVNSDGASHYRSSQALLPKCTSHVFPSVNGFPVGFLHPIHGDAQLVIQFSDTKHLVRKLWGNLYASSPWLEKPRNLIKDRARIDNGLLDDLYKLDQATGEFYAAAANHRLRLASVRPQGAECMRTSNALAALGAGATNLKRILPSMPQYDARSVDATSWFCSWALKVHDAASDRGRVFATPNIGQTAYGKIRDTNESGAKAQEYRGAAAANRAVVPYVHQALTATTAGAPKAVPVALAELARHPLDRLWQAFEVFEAWQKASEAEDQKESEVDKAERAREKAGMAGPRFKLQRKNKALRSQSFHDLKLLVSALTAFTYFYLECRNCNQTWIGNFCRANQLPVIGKCVHDNGLAAAAAQYRFCPDITFLTLKSVGINPYALVVVHPSGEQSISVKPAPVLDSLKGKYAHVLKYDMGPQTPQVNYRQTFQHPVETVHELLGQVHDGHPCYSALQSFENPPEGVVRFDWATAIFALFVRLNTDDIENLFSMMRGFGQLSFSMGAIPAPEVGQRFEAARNALLHKNAGTGHAAVKLTYQRPEGDGVVRSQDSPRAKIVNLPLPGSVNSVKHMPSSFFGALSPETQRQIARQSAELFRAGSEEAVSP